MYHESMPVSSLSESITTPVSSLPSEPVTFTAHDRQMLHEIHAAITGITSVIESLPLDKLSKSPIFRMLGM